MAKNTAAQQLGRKGGLARAKALSPERRRSIARKGAQARLQSLELARRITMNFRYAKTVQLLSGGKPTVISVSRCAGPLPTSRCRPQPRTSQR